MSWIVAIVDKADESLKQECFEKRTDAMNRANQLKELLAIAREPGMMRVILKYDVRPCEKKPPR